MRHRNVRYSAKSDIIGCGAQRRAGDVASACCCSSNLAAGDCGGEGRACARSVGGFRDADVRTLGQVPGPVGYAALAFVQGHGWSPACLACDRFAGLVRAGVQQESTATGADAGGRAGTREDGDLHGWTRVDVLPPDGMQEVSGSSPLSSTGQIRNSNKSNSEYSSKVPQRRPDGPPYVCSDRMPAPARAAGRSADSRRHNDAVRPVSWANPCSPERVTLAAGPPSSGCGRAFPL